MLARQRPLPTTEVSVFRWFNAAPDRVADLLWPIMQLGTFLAPLVVAVFVLAVTGRRRPALDVVAAGVLAWSLAKVVKLLVGRERPAYFLDDAHVRDTLGGWGFASGHTAMAFAMATALAPWLPRWGQVSVFGVAVFVGVARMVFGAHLPLDVVGGAGLGLLCGLASQLLFEVVIRGSSPGPSTEAVATSREAAPRPSE